MGKTRDVHQAIDIVRAMIPTLSLWLAIALLIAAIGAAVYVAFFWRPGPALIGPPAGAARTISACSTGGDAAVTQPAHR